MLQDVELQLQEEKEDIEKLTIDLLEKIDRIKKGKEINEKNVNNLLAWFKSVNIKILVNVIFFI